jgi:endonuclease/exonuclease/phosphatase family metal-dependent hydrolase
MSAVFFIEPQRRRGAKWKLRHFFIAGLLLASVAGSWLPGYSQQPVPLKVMTFNIRYDNPDDGQYSWNERKEMVFTVILMNRPDIIGFQEVLKGQLDDLKKNISGYIAFGAGRDDGREAGEYAAVFFDSSRFVLLQGSDFWLSETPDVPGTRSWGAACNRIVTWVRLSDRESQRNFFVFNTHFDHVSSLAREQSARLLLERIHGICGNEPVFVTGDFNDTREGKPYHLMVSGNELLNAGDVSRSPGEGPDYTFIGFPFNPSPGNTIDFIFLKNDTTIRVTRHRVITYNRENRYPSDHLPVIAEFELLEILK